MPECRKCCALPAIGCFFTFVINKERRILHIRSTDEWVGERGVMHPRLPISKSIAARQILMAYLADDANILPRSIPDLPKDVELLLAAVHQLAAQKEGESIEVSVGESGTALRLLLSAIAFKSRGPVRLVGEGRIPERPIKPLVEALRSLGADISCVVSGQSVPLLVRPAKLQVLSPLHIDARESSQYISSLMLLAPYLSEGLQIHPEGITPSLDYVRLTLELMRSRGVAVAWEFEGERLSAITIPRGCYQKREALDLIAMEADWSSACFWVEYLLISEREETLFFENLLLASPQADRAIIDLCKPLGILAESAVGGVYISYKKPATSPSSPAKLNANLATCPDLVPALVLTCLFRGQPFRFAGVGHLRHKESDRIAALAQGVAALGFDLDTGGDAIAWDRSRLREIGDTAPLIQVYGDHRIAMAFAMTSAALRSGVCIADPEVVTKSYPNFWEEVRRWLRFQLSPVSS